MSNFEDENKKKILNEQEKDFAKDKESSQPLLLTDELKAEGIEMISYFQEISICRRLQRSFCSYQFIQRQYFQNSSIF